MSSFGKCCFWIVLFFAMTAHQPTTMAMVAAPELRDMYPEMINGDYCLCMKDTKFHKRNNELIHNLDRVRGIMNLG